MKIWLDDEREMPDDYDTHCRTVEGAILWLETGNVVAISLDNDLGAGYTEGRKLAQWIEHQAYLGTLPKLQWSVHTGNPAAAKEMYDTLLRANKYWAERKW